MEKAAAALETRRYLALLGGTTEFSKWVLPSLDTVLVTAAAVLVGLSHQHAPCVGSAWCSITHAFSAIGE